MFVDQAWKGRQPLWKVFWIHGVLASTFVTGVFVWLARDTTSPWESGLHQVLLLAFVPYCVWLLVSIWRCSHNARNPYYGSLARSMTVAWAINAALLLLFIELDLL